jgi:ribonuclease P protein component
LVTLVRKKDFKNLVEQGKRIKPAPWLLINYEKNELGFLRFGFTATRKMGNAVVRNKLRRWCREFFRKQENKVGVDLNILVLESKKPNFFKELKHEQLEIVLENAYKKICQSI